MKKGKNIFLLTLIVIFTANITAFACMMDDMSGMVDKVKDKVKNFLKKEETVTCLIDGMRMKKKEAVSYQVQEETFYFCNKEEIKLFKKSPTKYLKRTVFCPVSKIRVLKKKSPSYKYLGKTYYFCCNKDLKEFKENLEQYL